MTGKIECPKIVHFAFNVSKSSNPVFKDSIATILWACIKAQHIADQSFDASILDTAVFIKQHKPQTYEEFIKIIATSALRKYGTVITESVYRPYCSVLSDVFWKGVWNRLTQDGITILFDNVTLTVRPAIVLTTSVNEG